MINLDEVFEYLYANRAKDLPPDALAEVFERLIWCLSDNGEGIVKKQYEWLTSQDQEKVKIALEMREVFPFTNLAHMNEVLASIEAQWPELRAKCDETTALASSVGVAPNGCSRLMSHWAWKT